MEDKKSSPKKKLPSKKQEKVIRQVKCDCDAAVTHASKKRLPDLEILQKKSNNQKPPERVFVTINHRSPAIKTIYLAEKSRFNSRRGSEQSKSALAIGDHPSFNAYFPDTRSSSACPITGKTGKKPRERKDILNKPVDQVITTQSQEASPPKKTYIYTKDLAPSEKCYVHTHRRIHLIKHNKPNKNVNLVSDFTEDIRNFIHANYSDKNLSPSINHLNKKIQRLESLVRRQEMVLDDNDHSLSSSDEGSRDNMPRNRSESRPGCSYIEHYSHVPETSAFQRYSQQSGPLSSNKGTTIEKEHNSEQYGRDFTAYDGLTARGRRQCASATTKRDDQPQQAAERMIKIRHKLNPVRDYRLMDTVHYLAQGEFAPRNDGIKLTPSREAVLSDIIWEDVCRTHWPTARLGRRHAQQERCNTRSELQRLIDSLLRERVAHVERRRRRHYRIVKLNNRQEHGSGRVGKTGDIIVASHKHKHPRDDNDAGLTGHNASGVILSSKRWPERSAYRHHRSDDRLESPEVSQRRRMVQEDCTPGPSYAVPRAPSRREPTCCYHAAGPSRQPERSYKTTREDTKEVLSSSSSASSEKYRSRNPRLVVKKDPSRRKYHQKEELNLEHFILLPTLVVRTPSNVKRQKKFNELYHRILNQLSTEQDDAARDEPTNHQTHCKNSTTSMGRGKNQ